MSDKTKAELQTEIRYLNSQIGTLKELLAKSEAEEVRQRGIGNKNWNDMSTAQSERNNALGEAAEIRKTLMSVIQFAGQNCEIT
jgi:hypothetical protein